MDNTRNISASIDLFLQSIPYLAINEQFGVSELNRYYSDLALLGTGTVTLADLGFSEKRAAALPKVMCAAGSIVTARNLAANDIIKPNSIAVLKLHGVMRSQDGLSHYGMESFGEWLRAAYSNPNIDGIILDVESGGGEWLAGNRIVSVLSERNKPVISHVSLAASAAYMAVSETDEIIMANEGAQVGSIGVFMPINKQALEKYRATYDFVYSTKSPDKNAGDRGILAGDYTEIQKEIDALAVQFQKMVTDRRDLKGSKETINKSLSGGMFSALDSKQRGLSDSMGNMQYAVKRLYAMKDNKYNKKKKL